MGLDLLMIDKLAKNLVELKKEFVRVYDGKSQIQEVIPKSKSTLFPIERISFRITTSVCNKESYLS